MKRMTAFGIAAVFPLVHVSSAPAEIINGTAKVLTAPNGKPIFTIKDGQQVDVISENGAWRQIQWVVDQPISSLEGAVIKPGQKLLDHGNNEYGVTFSKVQVQKPKKTKRGSIRGQVSGFVQESSLKKLKFNIAPGITPKLGYHLIPTLIDQNVFFQRSLGCAPASC